MIFYRVTGNQFGAQRRAAPGEFATLSLEVSVPSTGRSGLQPVHPKDYHCPRPTFQYPLRVEVGCNRTGFDARSDLDEVIIARLDSAVAIPFSFFEREFVQNALRLVLTGQWARLTLNMQYRLRGEKPR